MKECVAVGNGVDDAAVVGDGVWVVRKRKIQEKSRRPPTTLRVTTERLTVTRPGVQLQATSLGRVALGAMEADEVRISARLGPSPRRQA
jgi:hypothetical protein